MSTRYPDVVSEQQVVESQVNITAAYGGAGQEVTSSSSTSRVLLRNYNSPYYGIEYQIDSGPWLALGGGAETHLDIDLTVVSLKVRRAEFAPPIQLIVSMEADVSDPVLLIVSDLEPSDDDGRPNGTIWIQTA